MNRTNRNALMSLIAGLALSAPVFATTEMDKLMASLDSARASLNAHRDNVQTLESEIASIRKEIGALQTKYAETGDPAVKAELSWEMSNLERFQIRLADEQNAVLEWSQVVQSIMAEINRVDAQSSQKSEPVKGKVSTAPTSIGSKGAK